MEESWSSTPKSKNWVPNRRHGDGLSAAQRRGEGNRRPLLGKKRVTPNKHGTITHPKTPQALGRQTGGNRDKADKEDLR